MVSDNILDKIVLSTSNFIISKGFKVHDTSIFDHFIITTYSFIDFCEDKVTVLTHDKPLYKPNEVSKFVNNRQRDLKYGLPIGYYQQYQYIDIADPEFLDKLLEGLEQHQKIHSDDGDEVVR